MKIVETISLIDNVPDDKRGFIEERRNEIITAIRNVVHPAGMAEFIINPKKHGNGVAPIKNAFIDTLRNNNWQTEFRMSLVSGVEPGPIDAIYRDIATNLIYAVEWETGNIASSHRALSKLLLGMMEQKIIAGTLVLPSRDLYPYLTDRIGNIRELLPYFPIWRHPEIEGLLSVIVIEHDGESDTVPFIPKGTDGHARR